MATKGGRFSKADRETGIWFRSFGAGERIVYRKAGKTDRPLKKAGCRFDFLGRSISVLCSSAAVGGGRFFIGFFVIWSEDHGGDDAFGIS